MSKTLFHNQVNFTDYVVYSAHCHIDNNSIVSPSLDD